MIESRFLYEDKLASLRIDSARATLTALLARRNRTFKTLLLVESGSIAGHVAAALAYRQTAMI